MHDKKSFFSKVFTRSNVLVGVIIILSALLIASGYFNYIYYKIYNLNPISLAKINKEQKSLQDKIINGTVENISAEKIKLKSLTKTEDKTYDISLTKNTIYLKAPSGGGILQDATFKDIKKGDTVMVWLTGKQTDKELIAEKISKL